jgi:uncharacterized membrane protein
MSKIILDNVYQFLALHLGSKELIAAILAAFPFVEARYAILIAYHHMHIPLARAFVICVAANMLPVVPILLFFEPVCKHLRRFKLWSNFFDWLFKRTRQKARLVESYEIIGLILFVSIPIPITGAWSGALAAVLFKVKRRHAVFAIFTGIIISSLIALLIYHVSCGGYLWLRQYP